VTLLYAITLPLLGFFTYYYWHALVKYINGIRMLRMANKEGKIIHMLVQSRVYIMNELSKMKAEFLSSGHAL
jgi:hypothetical protein